MITDMPQPTLVAQPPAFPALSTLFAQRGVALLSCIAFGCANSSSRPATNAQGRADSSASSKGPRKPGSRLCELTIVPRAGSPRQVFGLPQVAPLGLPIHIDSDEPGPVRFRYDRDGRVIEAAEAKYTYQGALRVTLSWQGRDRTLQLDARGRIVRDGRTTYSYDAKGRLVEQRAEERYLQYVYAPDGTFTTKHNYPDTDEFCVSFVVEATRDARGRVASERYDGCQIYEIAHTRYYQYGVEGLEGIDFDYDSDGTIDLRVELHYGC